MIFLAIALIGMIAFLVFAVWLVLTNSTESS